METNEDKTANRRQLVVMAIASVVMLALVGLMLNWALGSKSGNARKPTRISLVPMTPPPPPPPKEEKKPEPPKEKEVKIDRPLEHKDAPPPDNQLKMEGKAGNDPSIFGRGTVTNENAIGGGKPGGGSGVLNPYKNYAGLIKTELQRFLGRRADLRRRRYRIEVQVWVANDGTIKRSELLGTSGDTDIDDAVRQALTALPSFSESPPQNMPQPIHLRIVTSGRA